MANLCSSLITHGRIKTTLAKAKALRPYTERVITFAKKGNAASTPEEKLHFYRQVLSKVRDPQAVTMLFDERASEFVSREGGYTRIYKIGNRVGDAAPMALIELIPADDEGYGKRARSKSKAIKATGGSTAAEATTLEADAVDVEVATEQPEEPGFEPEADTKKE